MVISFFQSITARTAGRTIVTVGDVPPRLRRLDPLSRLAASLASFFLERRGNAEPEPNSDLREVLERLERIERRLDQQSTPD
jgi:hypothetical protein